MVLVVMEAGALALVSLPAQSQHWSVRDAFLLVHSDPWLLTVCCRVISRTCRKGS